MCIHVPRTVDAYAVVISQSKVLPCVNGDLVYVMCPFYFIRPLIGNQKAAKLWSAICFKIMTQYTCGFLPRILAIFPALRFFFPKYVTIFLSNAHIYEHNKSPYICVTNKHVYMGSQKAVV